MSLSCFSKSTAQLGCLLVLPVSAGHRPHTLVCVCAPCVCPMQGGRAGHCDRLDTLPLGTCHSSCRKRIAAHAAWWQGGAHAGRQQQAIRRCDRQQQAVSGSCWWAQALSRCCWRGQVLSRCCCWITSQACRQLRQRALLQHTAGASVLWVGLLYAAGSAAEQNCCASCRVAAGQQQRCKHLASRWHKLSPMTVCNAAALTDCCDWCVCPTRGWHMHCTGRVTHTVW
jgi:hypothetical protein